MTDQEQQQLTAAGNEMSASFLAAKKRSDATLAKLEAEPGKFTMLTGDRPTGRLHLGHYFGSIKERVAMQNRGVNTNIIIADYQVITDRDTTEHIQDNVLNLVLDYMAAGIDPTKTMMFTHSGTDAGQSAGPSSSADPGTSSDRSGRRHSPLVHERNARPARNHGRRPGHGQEPRGIHHGV